MNTFTLVAGQFCGIFSLGLIIFFFQYLFHNLSIFGIFFRSLLQLGVEKIFLGERHRRTRQKLVFKTFFNFLMGTTTEPFRSSKSSTASVFLAKSVFDNQFDNTANIQFDSVIFKTSTWDV